MCIVFLVNLRTTFVSSFGVYFGYSVVSFSGVTVGEKEEREED